MSIEIKLDYVAPMSKTDVISLLDGSISLKKANQLKAEYNQRIDYILHKISEDMGYSLDWYYFLDFTDTLENSEGLSLDSQVISYVNKEVNCENPQAVKGPFSKTFPLSWLYCEFEEELNRHSIQEKSQTHKITI